MSKQPNITDFDLRNAKAALDEALTDVAKDIQGAFDDLGFNVKVTYEGAVQKRAAPRSNTPTD